MDGVPARSCPRITARQRRAAPASTQAHDSAQPRRRRGALRMALAVVLAASCALVHELGRAPPPRAGATIAALIDAATLAFAALLLAVASSPSPAWGVWEELGLRRECSSVPLALVACACGVVAAVCVACAGVDLALFGIVVVAWKVVRRSIAAHLVPLALLRAGGWSGAWALLGGTALAIGARAIVESQAPHGVLALMRRRRLNRGVTASSITAEWAVDIVWGSAVALATNALAMTTGSVLVVGAWLLAISCTCQWRGTLVVAAGRAWRRGRWIKALLLSSAPLIILAGAVMIASIAAAATWQGTELGGTAPAPLAARPLLQELAQALNLRRYEAAGATAPATGSGLVPVAGLCPMGAL